MDRRTHKKCIIEGCNGLGNLDNGVRYFRKGYCKVHYHKLSKYGTPYGEYSYTPLQKCKVEGCSRNGFPNGKRGTVLFKLGYCTHHYYNLKKRGDANKMGNRHFDNRSVHPLYHTHKQMIQRCSYEKHPQYVDYGGRGITVCDRWLGVDGFTHFLEDMGDKPSKKHSIDRINNNKGYCPENCRWATSNHQNGNQRRNNEIVGVFYNKWANVWTANLCVDNKKYIKSFKDKNDAISYRKELELKYLNHDN
jgi:hypothetical protein